MPEDQEQAKNDPVCPYCGADPAMITARVIKFPNGLMLCVASCGNTECRRLLTASFMGMEQPRIMAVPGKLIS